MIGILNEAGELVKVVPDGDEDNWMSASDTVVVLPSDYDPVTVNYLFVDGVAVRNITPWIERIKAEAERRILVVAPLWRQINDVWTPTDPATIARRAEIDAIREWSNDQEALLVAGDYENAWPNGE